MKLFDSEWKVMEVLWQENDRTAKEISLRLADSIGWNKNTTYTVIKKCIDKGAIERWEPNFICHAVITKQQAQKDEADTLVDDLAGHVALTEARHVDLLCDFLASLVEIRVELLRVDGDGELHLGRLKIPDADFHACAPEKYGSSYFCR